MRQIFDARAERPVINALFIQPTYCCARSCKDCYVKEHERSGKQVSVTEMARLFELFHGSRGGECNQITISMDVVPHNHQPSRDWMIGFAQEVRIAQLNIYPESAVPEVHMTFKDIESFHEYECHVTGFLGQVALISLSDIKREDLSYIRALSKRYPQLAINYNHMSPEYLTNGSWNDHVELMEQILMEVDSVYLIAQKTPLGTDRDLLMVARDNKRMFHDLTYFKKLRNDIGSGKFLVDGCIKDVINFELEGFGCSSNVSRFQVWPDGSVSGCAYAKRADTSSAATAEGIIENIRKSRETYNFKQCHLPSTYHSLSEKAKAK